MTCFVEILSKASNSSLSLISSLTLIWVEWLLGIGFESSPETIWFWLTSCQNSDWNWANKKLYTVSYLNESLLSWDRFVFPMVMDSIMDAKQCLPWFMAQKGHTTADSDLWLDFLPKFSVNKLSQQKVGQHPCSRLIPYHGHFDFSQWFLPWFMPQKQKGRVTATTATADFVTVLVSKLAVIDWAHKKLDKIYVLELMVNVSLLSCDHFDFFIWTL